MLFIWVRTPTETADQPRCTLLHLVIRLLRWDFEALPGQMESVVPLACSGGAFHLVNVAVFYFIFLASVTSLFFSSPSSSQRRAKEVRGRRQQWTVTHSHITYQMPNVRKTNMASAKTKNRAHVLPELKKSTTADIRKCKCRNLRHRVGTLIHRFSVSFE